MKNANIEFKTLFSVLKEIKQKDVALTQKVQLLAVLNFILLVDITCIIGRGFFKFIYFNYEHTI